MKKSQDRPMADKSKVSSAHPSMADKKGTPSGSSPAKGICARGIDMCQGEAPSLKEFVPMPEAQSCRNMYGIGEGDGGASIDMIGPSNPGKGL